jgi:hypothetical protein
MSLEVDGVLGLAMLDPKQDLTGVRRQIEGALMEGE